MFYCYYTRVPGINKGIHYIFVCSFFFEVNLYPSIAVTIDCSWQFGSIFLNGDKLLLLFIDAQFQFLSRISKWMSCEFSHMLTVWKVLEDA